MNLEIERYEGELRELRARVAAIDMLPQRVDQTAKDRHEGLTTVEPVCCNHDCNEGRDCPLRR
jgi:hypothetical protein